VETNALGVYYYPFGQSYITPVLSAGSEGQLFIHDLALFLAQQYGCDVSLFDAKQLFADRAHGSVAYYSGTKECEEAMTTLFDLVVHRHNTHKDAQEAGETPEVFGHKVILVASLTNLKETLSEDASDKWNLILEKGNVKFNTSIVFAEKSSGVSMFTYDKWYQQHISAGDGIWVGNGIAEQYQLKANRVTAELRDEVPGGFGYALQKGRAIKLKLLCSEQGGDDE